jgi:GNAT superfamily N-acetyltransferase
MLGQVMPSFRGKRTVHVPEWAHAAQEKGRRRIYQEMYAHLAGRWVADGCFVHLITLLADDAVASETFFWLGFGLQCVDALRGMSRPGSAAVDVSVRKADHRDLSIVVAFDCALLEHLWSSPILLPPSDTASRETVEAWLMDPRQAIFLAGPPRDPAAMLHVQPANPSAAFIISDPKTASIKAMFTREPLRTRGIGAALLDGALDWARNHGYERCAVDFESQNLSGSRFWLRHFRPVCYSMRRCVDQRSVAREAGA